MSPQAATPEVSDVESPELPLAPVVQKPSFVKRMGFVALNGWLVMHLFGVVVTPATVGPTSETLISGWRVVAPYLQALYLDHGYHYFAPEPGGSTLIGYSIELEDGSTVSGRFPDVETSPRLLYHRYFMMSEFLGSTDGEYREVLAAAYARSLMHKHNGVRCSLSTIQHNLPNMGWVRDGGTLEDPIGFIEEPLGLYEWDTP
jgi:hypothetical protein